MPKAKKLKAKKVTAKGGRKPVDSARAKWREAVNRAKQLKKRIKREIKGQNC